MMIVWLDVKIKKSGRTMSAAAITRGARAECVAASFQNRKVRSVRGIDVIGMAT